MAAQLNPEALSVEAQAERDLQTRANDTDNSQTASEFIDSQLQLEADAREILPYSFEHCTKPLGPLRQNIFACLTCNPPPKSSSESYTPAGVCYACSIACHGDHTLVELFGRRNFTCDCGTVRLPTTSACILRIDQKTGMKGAVCSEEPAKENSYNKNFKNLFCGCGEWYNANEQKGTMYQCLGLATEQDGGCGEDWWHPECLMGLSRDWYKSKVAKVDHTDFGNTTFQKSEAEAEADDEEHPVPAGFPAEDQFETLICYKCVASQPWIKRYAGSEGFLFLKKDAQNPVTSLRLGNNDINETAMKPPQRLPVQDHITSNSSKKRKAEADNTDEESSDAKKCKVEDEERCCQTPGSTSTCRAFRLAQPLTGPVSLLAAEDFRSRLCRCVECYPVIRGLPQLLEEEETYEPPLSEEGGDGAGSIGTGSLLDRGQAALSNVDRVRAIEGVMVYNHLRDKVKSFLQPFAENGQAVGAEDIKAYFEKLRGDAEAIRAAGGVMTKADEGPNGDSRREESGY